MTCSTITPTPTSPKPSTPSSSPQLAPQGPTQLLTALLARLPDATNRAMIDQAAVDFAFLNSKAARKRLVKVCFHLTDLGHLTEHRPVLDYRSEEQIRPLASLLQAGRYPK